MVQIKVKDLHPNPTSALPLEEFSLRQDVHFRKKRQHMHHTPLYSSELPKCTMSMRLRKNKTKPPPPTGEIPIISNFHELPVLFLGS